MLSQFEHEPQCSTTPLTLGLEVEPIGVELGKMKVRLTQYHTDEFPFWSKETHEKNVEIWTDEFVEKNGKDAFLDLTPEAQQSKFWGWAAAWENGVSFGEIS